MKPFILLTLLLSVVGVLYLLTRTTTYSLRSVTIPTNGIEEKIKNFVATEGPASPTILIDDKALERYVRKYGPVATMNTVAQTGSSSKTDCHGTAHTLGRLSYDIFGKEVFSLNLQDCHSGFYHGTIEAFFKQYGVKNLQQNLNFICKGITEEFFVHQCMHGIGHGLAAWTDYDLPKSLEYCNLLPRENNRASCRTGVFMENIVGGLSQDHRSQYLSDDPHFPCTVVKEGYKQDCYFLQTDRMIQLASNGFETVAQNCSEISEDFKYNCYSSMGRTISGRYKYKPSEAIAECQHISDPEYRKNCIGAIAQDMFWDKNGGKAGLEFCSFVSEDEGKEDCYGLINERAELFLNNSEKQALCLQFPEKYQSICKIN